MSLGRYSEDRGPVDVYYVVASFESEHHIQTAVNEHLMSSAATHNFLAGFNAFFMISSYRSKFKSNLLNNSSDAISQAPPERSTREHPKTKQVAN